MGKIYITGHRNPDLDSLCAATAYANLKNMTDSENEYIPIRCSNISDSVRKQMEVMGIDLPSYKRDVYPKVRDVMMKPSAHMQADAPIYDLIKTYSTDKPSVVPIYEGEKFKGLLSVDDITGWFLTDNKEKRSIYKFTLDNLIKVLHADILQRGRGDIVEGSILIGAATIDTFRKAVDEFPDSIVVMGTRTEHLEYAMQRQVPAIIITSGAGGEELDFSDYKGIVLLTDFGTADTIKRLRLAEPISSMMESETEVIEEDDLFVDAKAIFMTSHTRGLAVMDRGEFKGFVTRRCFLNTPKNKVILVDHNEPAQSVKGIETADVVEIIDHHRLDAVSTTMPIFIAAEPLGSTCTIVYQQYMRHGIMPDEYSAKVILTGVIADTLILRSPTTTAADISTAESLARLAKVPSIDEFGEKLFSITDNLAAQDAEKMILSDFKSYEQGGLRMGVGQCEVTTLKNIDEYADRYLDKLQEIANSQNLDWTLLMVTDVLREKSILLASDHRANRDLPYARIKKGMYNMPGVMSRKKQLLPTLLSATNIG
ncbi:MAG: putative manganese-dependent inorganic diphosphatase [Mogibacterium sp.]|nr:putative manganese-dependent inorganic diphosphatase [Mogibacterium sp.]